MSQEEKMSKEELQKLEEQAYFELCQILAISMETGDIEYLDNMIAAWKNKYKKILDNPSSNFKKKIEYLLNQYYSETVNYILSQIKFKEEKLIENQRKAIHKLYDILSNNKDMNTLKKEIKNWETKYPRESFLNMHKKRIDSIKREKNLEQYAFKQEEAFRDLYYDVINQSGNIDEIKSNLSDWKTKYSIDDKFTIDDFIKHQSDVKRYTSDEYLMSISKDVSQGIRQITREPSGSKSDIYTQDKAYKTLLQITNGSKDITKAFKWVYENSSIKFNDEYKSKILVATNFDYSPKYLSHLVHPKLNLNTSLVSLDEFKHINQIKEYSVLSYFNLLFNNGSITNAYFNTCVQSLYQKVNKVKNENIEKPKQENDSQDNENNISIDSISVSQTQESPGNESFERSNILIDSVSISKTQEDTTNLVKSPIDTLDKSKIINFSPLLFSVINAKVNRAEKIQEIDTEVILNLESSRENFSLEPLKQKA